METKGVTEDFSERGTLPWTLDTIRSTMDMIESIFEDCDAELANAGMSSLGYEKQDIDTLLEHLIILRDYAGIAYTQVCEKLDNPLYEGFVNGATQALSEIVLSDITTDNTFDMEEYVLYTEIDNQYCIKEKKDHLTMADFLGLEDVEPGTGVPALANVEALGWFTNLFRADYEIMGAAVESVDELLEIYLCAGEYSHEEHHPIKNFISGILDVTIVKPFIESIYGKDLITGEKLTDFERGMQLVNALIGAVTLGQGALALDFTKMAGKDIAVELLKPWGVDAISDMAALTVGYACDELGLPAGVSFVASLLTGYKVSTGVSGYVFRDASGNFVKELDVDEMQAWLKEMDVDLNFCVKEREVLVFGSGEFSYEIPINGYSDWVDGMSKADAVRYITNNEVAFFNEFSERASAAGLNATQIEEAFCTMRRGDYTKMATYFDTSSPVDGAVFWSGNKEAAASYANSIGGTVLEQTQGGQVFDDWKGLKSMYPTDWGEGGDLDVKPIWEALSTQYASGASGNVTYIVPETYDNPKSMWLNVEKPILDTLEDAKIVTNITTIIIK